MTWPVLVRTVLFPLHEALKGQPTLRALRAARRWDHLPPAAVTELQLSKLRRLLEHAQAHVPYYREALAAAGVEPAAIRSLADLQRLPLLTRPVLRAEAERLKARDRPRRLTPLPTGGSTGEPVTVWVDPRRAAVTTAARIRAREWWRVRPGDREAVLWASPIELSAQDRIRALRDRLLNSRLYSAFEGSPTGLRAIAADLVRFRPQVLYGYASSLHLLALHLEREPPPRPIRPRAIFATAEGLAPEEEERLERVFAAPVGREYGARDAGLIAHSCPAGSYHILAEGVLVEVVDREGRPVGSGERGEIVTTHLEAYGFPLLRYRTGDIGRLAREPCPCGRGLPCLEAVEGRSTDFLLAPDGRLIHALGAIYVLRELPGVEAFQVEQPARDRLVVTLVRGPAFPPDGTARIQAGLRRLLGAPVAVEVRFVSEIPRSASRKHRHVISPVAREVLTGAEEG